MKSIEINKGIKVSLFKVKDSINSNKISMTNNPQINMCDNKGELKDVCINKEGSLWVIILEKDDKSLYVISKWNIMLRGRILVSKKLIINLIKSSIKILEEWNKREIYIKGVGSKLLLENEVGGVTNRRRLGITLSNTDYWFDIPLDIELKVENNPLKLIIWGIHLSSIYSFKNLIKRKTKWKDF